MSAGADDDGGREDAALAHDADAVALAGHRGHPGALAHVGAGGPGAVEQVVIELAPDDAVAGRPAPARLVARAVEREPAGREGLDGERILLGIDLDVGQRLGRHPARADLDAREHGGVEQQRPEAGAGQPPGRGAAARPAADDDDVVRGHVSLARGPRGVAAGLAKRQPDLLDRVGDAHGREEIALEVDGALHVGLGEVERGRIAHEADERLRPMHDGRAHRRAVPPSLTSVPSHRRNAKPVGT